MARSLEARLAHLEARAIYREQQALYASIASEFGLSVAELLAEAHAFLAQPLETQLAEVGAMTAEFEADGLNIAEVKAALARGYRP